MKLRHRNHNGINRVRIARHNGLKRKPRLHRRYHWVFAGVWIGSMPTHTFHSDLPFIHRSHNRPRAGAQLTRLRKWIGVNGIDLINPEALHHALFDHDAPAANRLFRRLENQRDTSLKIARLTQIFRCTKQHRRVPVMAASVHLAVHFTGPLGPRLFLHRQRVHIRAQPRARPSTLTVDNGNNARLRDALMDLVYTKLAQPLDHKGRRLVTVQRQLWVHMNMPPPARHFFGKARNPIYHRHVLRLLSAQIP